MTTRWSAVSAISLIRCEERKTVRPSRGQLLEQVADPEDALRIEAVGRARRGSSVAGSPSSAAAIPRRCPMPREKPPTRLRATLCSPTRSITSTTRQVGDAVGLRHGQQVVVRRSAGVDRARLEHRADLAQRRREVAVAAAVDRRRPGGRRIEADDHAHRRRLAGAVGPEEAGDATGPDLEAQVIDGQRVAVALAQMRDIDHRRR